MLPEKITTINDSRTAAYREKGSEFIGIAYPVVDEQDALNRLNEIRRKYHDATHHCYAYKFRNGESRYSDDGEPKGTAGIRLFNALEHYGLRDVLLVIVRYFGGTKLGVGPLGKAYHTASMEVLEKTEKVDLDLFQSVVIKSDFQYLNHIHRITSNCNARIQNTGFTDSAVFDCLVKPKHLEKLISELTNLSNGQILISPSKDFTYEKCN